MHIEYINHFHNKLYDCTIKTRVWYLQTAYHKSKIFSCIIQLNP